MSKPQKKGSEGSTANSVAIKKKTADGPRAPKPAKRSAPKEAQAGGPFGPHYSDASLNGVFDARAAFDAAHGEPNPRQRGQRGEDVGSKSDTQGPFPAPLD